MARLPKLDMNGIAYTFKLIPKAAQGLFPDYLTCHNLLSKIRICYSSGVIWTLVLGLKKLTTNGLCNFSQFLDLCIAKN